MSYNNNKITLEGFASKLAAKNKFIKASIGGFAGSGKTRTGSQFVIGCYQDMKIEKPLLLLDNEKGSRFLIPEFEKAGIEVYNKETTELGDVLDAFTLLNEGSIGFLFIDSLSKVWYKYIDNYKIKNRVKFMTLQDWGKILPEWQKTFSDAFVELNGNCVFTGRGGFQYEKEEDTTDDRGNVKKGQFVKSGVKMKMAGETPFEPDLNIWMDMVQDIDKNGKHIVYREATIMKDRSSLIDGKTFKNPTYEVFKPVIEYLCNVRTGEVKGASNTTNLAPSEDWGRYEEKQKREIEIDKIQAEFVAFGFGATKDEKQLKIAILEKFFSTKSWEEIQTYRLDRLHNGRIGLEKFLKELKEEKPTDPLQFTIDYIPGPDEKEPSFVFDGDENV